MAASFVERFQKAFMIDIIKGRLGSKNRNHLIRKTIINRLGRKQTVWVKPEEFPSEKKLKFDFNYFNVQKRFKVDFSIFLATVRYYFANKEKLSKFLKTETKKPWLEGKDYSDEARKKAKVKKKTGTRKYSIALLKLLQKIYGDEYDRGRYPFEEQKKSGDDGSGGGDGTGGDGRGGIESIPGDIPRDLDFERYKADGIAIGRASDQQFSTNNYIPEDLRGALRQHQADFVNLAIEKFNEGNKGIFNFDGTGAGKTRQAIAVANVFNQNKDKKVLVITQNTTIINDAFQKDSVAMGLGELNVPTDASQLSTERPNIVPYTQLGKYENEKFDLVILDEAHNLKNADTNKATQGLKIVQNATHTCNFSATPIDKVEHLNYIAKTLDIDYVTLAESMGYEFKTLKNGDQRLIKDPNIPMEEVARRLDKFFTDLTQKGLCTKREVPLNNLTLSISQHDFPNEFYQKYIKAISRYHQLIEAGGPFRANGLMGLNRLTERAKADVVIKGIKDSLAKGEQVVVFAESLNSSVVHREVIRNPNGSVMDVMQESAPGTIQIIQEELKNMGISYGLVAGGRGNKAKANKIDQDIKDFQSGKLKIMLGTPKSGGTGISLDDVQGDAPRKMFLMTPPFSAVDFIQSIGRINRLTTKSKAAAELVTIKGSTSDEWTSSIIANKVKALGASVQGDYGKIDIEKLQNASEIDEYEKQEDILKKQSVKYNNPINFIQDLREFGASAMSHVRITPELVPGIKLDSESEKNVMGKTLVDAIVKDPDAVEYILTSIGDAGLARKIVNLEDPRPKNNIDYSSKELSTLYKRIKALPKHITVQGKTLENWKNTDEEGYYNILNSANIPPDKVILKSIIGLQYYKKRKVLFQNTISDIVKSTLIYIIKAKRRKEVETWTQPSGRVVTKKNGKIIPIPKGRRKVVVITYKAKSFILQKLDQIDILKARPVKYKYKISTGNPKRPYKYFYNDKEYQKYLKTIQATNKAKRDTKNLTPHTPTPVPSVPTSHGIKRDEDVKSQAPTFQLEQETVQPTGKKEISSEPNLFGITERTERKFLNQNFQPKFNPSREIMSVGDLVTEVKSALLKEGMEAKAKKWIDATYNTKSTLSNVLNLAYKFVIIDSKLANVLRKQIVKSSVRDTKQELIDPNSRKQTLEEHGKDPETPVPRLNDIDKKELERAKDTSKLSQAMMGNQNAKGKHKTWLLTAYQKGSEPGDSTMNIAPNHEGMTAPSNSQGLDSSIGEKSQEENPFIVTDPASVQRFKNSIAEGESILQSGKFHGRKLSSEELESIQRSVDYTKRRIGELPPSSDPAIRIRDFLRYITFYDTSNEALSISLGKVNDSVAQRIKELTGIDVTGFQHKLSKYDVKHILNSHGGQSEKLRGQIPIEESDLELIPKIISEPDSVELERKSHQGLFAIKYTKKIGSDYFVIEEIRKPKEELSLKTMYKRAGRREPMAINPQHLTSETFPPADSTMTESDTISQAKNFSFDDPSIKKEINSIVQDVKFELERRDREFDILRKNAFDIGKPVKITKSGISGYVQSSEVESVGIDYKLKYLVRDNQGNIHEVWSDEIETQPIVVPEQIANTIQLTTPETRNKATKELFGSKPTKISKQEWAKQSVDVNYNPPTITMNYFDGNPIQAKDYSGMDQSLIMPYDKTMGCGDLEPPKWMPKWKNPYYDKFRIIYADIIVNGEKKYICDVSGERRGYEEYAIITQEQIIAIESFYLNKAKELHQKYKKMAKTTAYINIPDSIRMYKKRPLQQQANVMFQKQFNMLYEKMFGEMPKRFSPNFKNNQRSVFAHYKELVDDMKWREVDLRLGFQDAYEESTYQKGKETAYGDSGTIDTIQDSHGVLVKMQNGKPVDANSLSQIKNSMDEIFSVFGDRKSMAGKFGLKISHSGQKKMHASKFAGLFHPIYKSIGVSFQSEKQGTFTLAHEFGHFMDYYLGKKENENKHENFRQRNYVSCKDGIENKIAKTFRKGMSKEFISKEYWSRSTECFARALEQYFAIKKNYGYSKNDGANPDQEYYAKNVLPLVEKFFQEKDNVLKSFFANFYNRKRQSIKNKVLESVRKAKIA